MIIYLERRNLREEGLETPESVYCIKGELVTLMAARSCGSSCMKLFVHTQMDQETESWARAGTRLESVRLALQGPISSFSAPPSEDSTKWWLRWGLIIQDMSLGGDTTHRAVTESFPELLSHRLLWGVLAVTPCEVEQPHRLYSDVKGCPCTSLCLRRPWVTDGPLHHRSSLFLQRQKLHFISAPVNIS